MRLWRYPNAKWRERHAEFLATTGPLEDFYTNRFEFKVDRDITPEYTPWDLFRLAFEGELLHGRGGATRPLGIATDPNALEVWFATLRSGDDLFDIEAPFLPLFFARFQDGASDDDLSQLHWARGQAYMGWGHWAPPISYQEALECDGAVRFARVHCVMRTAGGGVIPTVFVLYLDPPRASGICRIIRTR